MAGKPKAIYFTTEESDAIRRTARDLDISDSFLVRAAVRLLLGMHVSTAFRRIAAEMDPHEPGTHTAASR